MQGPLRPEREHMDRQTLSIMKACEVVGVSRRTIYNWISAGKVEYVRTAGGAIRIFADSLWRDAASPARQVSASARPTGSPA
jgi:excisionase family DNA binding protein